MSIRNRMGLGAIALAALMAAGCADTGPTETLNPADAHFAHVPGGPPGAELGTTPGWFKGERVTFFYNKEFECFNPPSSDAMSGCVLGEEAAMAPRGGNDPVLYVITPLGFRPSNEATLHCPVAGDCINHPDDIDVSRVFPDLGVIPLPAHSHIIDVKRGGWWKIEVNGVFDQATWDEIVAEPSLAKIRELQAQERVTPDIDTNLFLFFNVMPENNRRGGPFNR
jgi:hypothetical protein